MTPRDGTPLGIRNQGTSHQRHHGMFTMGWSPWDGHHEMVTMGWSPWDGYHGMVIMRWSPCKWEVLMHNFLAKKLGLVIVR